LSSPAPLPQRHRASWQLVNGAGLGRRQGGLADQLTSRDKRLDLPLDLPGSQRRCGCPRASSLRDSCATVGRRSVRFWAVPRRLKRP